MAKQVTIPLTSSDCILYYVVEYKTTGEVGYTFNQQYFTQPIVLENLADDTSYDIRITPYCCDGTVGTPTTTTFDTTDLPAPTSFNVVQSGINADLDWDDYVGATSYEWQRASNAAFTTGLTDVFSAAISFATDANPGAGTWWYRVRAIVGGVGSDWATDSVTIV